ncbi:MAG: DNA polymerase III subunit alpha [Acidobacteria bacterium]|nr:DNA polymerase III subunit alpha [Acidobacteriota bacterium]
MIAHLHCRSYHSFLDGASPPEDLVGLAAASGVTHLALTDDAGVYGAVDFSRRAEAAGIHPIVGAELPLPGNARVTALCRDAEGYAALCRALTIHHLSPEKAKTRSTVETLAPLAKGNWLLVDDPRLLSQLAAGGLREGLGAEIVRHGTAGERGRLRGLRREAEKLDIPLVGTNAVRFAREEDWETHRLLSAIRVRGTVGRLAEGEVASREAWLKPPDRMRALFEEFPGALTNALRLAESCEFRYTTGRALHPPFPVPENTTAEAVLRAKSTAGLALRYATPSPRVLRQLDFELSVIHETGFDEYFLIVKDVVDFALDRGIPLVGRGSAGGSLVAYLLGITPVDPLALNLSFERFLNPRRTDPPDIDIDFCWRRRPEVIRYLYDSYGEANTAMLSTHVRMAGRGAIRETSRALGLAEAEISRFTRHIPHHDARHLDQVLAEIPECRNVPFHLEPFRTIIAWAKKIAGHPRHLGLHPCGIVLSRVPLDRVTPLQRTATGFPATQLEMRQAEDVGLLKIDILGQRALSVIADVGASPDWPPEIDPGGGPANGSPESDPAAWELIRSGRTLGCFQIESPGMRSLLVKLQPKDMETIIAASSVIRPGPSDAGMLREYILRYHGKRPVSYLHPSLEPILRSTLGIMVYQEDILRTAEAVAGMSADEADMLRRAMSAKRSAEAMRALKDTFVSKAVDRGVEEKTAREIWRRMETFSGYAFCKAHSASYAALSWLMARMKAHCPARFFAALINNGGGFYHADAYLSDARRFGVSVLPPDLNRSGKGFTVENILPGPPDDSNEALRPKGSPPMPVPVGIRVGLERVRDLTATTLERILGERETRGPFRSLRDFLARCRPSPVEAGNLVQCGAAGCFGANRPRLLWELEMSRSTLRNAGAGPAPRSGDLLDGAEGLDDTGSSGIPDVADYAFEEKLRLEAELLELHVSGHPLDLWRDRVAAIPRLRAVDLPTRRNRRARLAGRLVTTRRVFTKTRQYMKFLTLEDETGLFEAVFFPEAYAKWGDVVSDPGVYVVEGKVADEFGSLSLEADAVYPIQAFPG